MEGHIVCRRCGRPHTYKEYSESKFCGHCGTWLSLTDSGQWKRTSTSVEHDSWDRWKGDVEELRTTLPCTGREYRWLKGYLGNPSSRIIFICEIPSLSKRFTQRQPRDSTDENLQWNVHGGDWLFRDLLCEFGFKTNSPREADGWECWITDFIKCPIENLNALDENARRSLITRSAEILEREMRLLNPVLIVTVGNNADKYFDEHVLTNVPKQKVTHYSYIMLRPDRNGRKAGDPERIEAYRAEFRRIRGRYEEELNRQTERRQATQAQRQKYEASQGSRPNPSARVDELVTRMIEEIPRLGDDVRRCYLKSRIRFEREGHGRKERRIVALVQNKNSITAHLPYNRTFKSQVSQMTLWPQALSYDTRGFSYLKGIDNENRTQIALDVIEIAYKSLNVSI